MLCSLSSRPLFMFSVMASTVIAGATIASLGSDARASTAQASAAKGGDTASAAVSYDVDDVHSKALFRVHHLGAGQFWGVFEDVKGTANYEPGKKLSLDVSIDTKSVDSGNSDLDKHLRSPDFFDVKEFPAMTFKSTSAEMKSANLWHVTGDLTIRGKTKRVTVPIEVTGVSSTGMGVRSGYEAVFTIKRSEYGINYGVENGALGDETRVIVSIEGIKREAAASN
jgi:polyisoprenoid-binding protein YceI